MAEETIRAAYEAAAGKWTGCDWPVRFGELGLDLNGLKARHAALMAGATSGREAAAWRAAVQWLEAVEQDARQAEEEARTALRLATAGNPREALEHARRALALESQHVARRVWQPLCDALERALSPQPVAQSAGSSGSDRGHRC